MALKRKVTPKRSELISSSLLSSSSDSDDHRCSHRKRRKRKHKERRKGCHSNINDESQTVVPCFQNSKQLSHVNQLTYYMTLTGNFVPHIKTGQAGHPGFWDPSYSDVGQHASQSRSFAYFWLPCINTCLL